jgi:lambda family phage minor tail protein L
VTTPPPKLFELGQDAMIELNIIDASAIGDTLYHFAQNDIYGDGVIWQGVTYSPFPIIVAGFERRANGSLPRPTMIVSNANGIVSGICAATNDLIGAKVSRIRTFRKYLDAANFSGGNPTANPNIELPREVWRVDRRAAELRQTVTFELAAPWDVNGVKLPRRMVVQNNCIWAYRSAECGYAGGPVATVGDDPTANPLLDACGKRVASCKLRFGEEAELPFGGFPSVGQTSANT